MAERRLLVTGATGMVGRHVIALAPGLGFETWAVSSRPDGPDEVGGTDVTWRVRNLIAEGEAARLVEEVRPTHLIHAAWDTRHAIYWRSPENLAWLAATAQMAAAFARAGGRRFVLAGTCAEYDWSDGVMVEDRTPERPDTLYGRCKLAAHHSVLGAARDLGFSAATARIFFAYGPHENPNRVIPYACRTLAAGQTPRLSSGRQLRDLLHVRDVARAFLILVEQEDLVGAVNIGSGQPITLGEAARILAAAAGAPERSGVGLAPDRPGDPLVLTPDTERLRSTGFKPELGVEDGLRSAYEWWLGQAGAGAS